MQPRRARRIDDNQNDIVASLRKIAGVTVEVDHDDILVGRMGLNYWYELKNSGCVGKDGEIKESEIRPSQKKLRKEWRGHYKIVSSLDEILNDMGLICCDKTTI